MWKKITFNHEPIKNKSVAQLQQQNNFQSNKYIAQIYKILNRQKLYSKIDVQQNYPPSTKNILEGRDKLTKFLIYFFKLIDSIKTIRKGLPTYRYERIGFHFQRARQFMRLGKFINEYVMVIKLIQNGHGDQFGRLIRIIIHTFFFFYWILDNIRLASYFDLLEIPEFRVTQTAMTIKFIGLVIAALLNIRSWMRLHHAQLKARKALKYLKGEQNLQKNQQLLELINQQWKMFLLCLKIYGEMLPSIAKSVIAIKILNFKIPRILQALGGLLNAFVSCLLTSMQQNSIE